MAPRDDAGERGPAGGDAAETERAFFFVPARVSGMKKNAAIRSATAIAAAPSGGAHIPKRLSAPPIAGPSTSPSPMPAPRRPMPRARRSPVVTSAMAAWQAARLPAVAPASTRDTKKSDKSDTFVARANSTIETAFPARLKRITLRRPTRSERRPRNGVATSCVNEKQDRRNQPVLADPPIDFT